MTPDERESQTNSERLKRLEEIEATPDNRPGDRIMILLKDFDYLCSELRKSLAIEAVSDSCQKREETKNIGAESVKPREFWLKDINDYEPVIFDEKAVSKFRSDFRANNDYIHVIEYSAYEALKKKFTEVFGPAGFKSVSKMLEERDQLLTSVVSSNKLVEELRAQCDRLAEDIRGMEGFATKSPALAEFEKSKGEHD